MKKVIFYSWQSDLSNATNRGLIESALKVAAKEIASDGDIHVEPVIDRDTQGVPGAPDIAATIFGKIAAADIFVADISLVLNGTKRSTPNPNVLIELGYALKAHGHERIVLVFNEASGKKEKLPFDLKTRRVLSYKSTVANTDRSAIRAELAKDFKAALLAGFAYVGPENSMAILDIIKSSAPSRIIDLRTYLGSVLKDLEQIQPSMTRNGGTVEQLIGALPRTVPLVADLARLSEIVAVMNDMESARAIFQWFGKILTQYNPTLSGGGTSWNSDGDFFKFIGHELFVTFITPFLREERWSELHELLQGTLQVGPNNHARRETRVSWAQLAEYLPSLADESTKQRRKSVHADLLKERHEKDELAMIIPFDDFAQTDFFLYLHGLNASEGEYSPNWYPHSSLWLERIPSFIIEAENYQKAMLICYTLGMSDIEELKRRLVASRKLGYAGIPPISEAEINKIGNVGGGVVVSSDDANIDPHYYRPPEY